MPYGPPQQNSDLALLMAAIARAGNADAAQGKTDSLKSLNLGDSGIGQLAQGYTDLLRQRDQFRGLAGVGKLIGGGAGGASGGGAASAMPPLQGAMQGDMVSGDELLDPKRNWLHSL
jgi:hypothetical protein